jgi:tetratricopeptide (TPR) repeat protein
MNRSMLVLAILVLFAWPARAQDSSIEEAKAHAARAKVHYDLGEYEKAAEEYIVVYRIKPLPALLYNIAQSYRQAGQYEKARQFYKSYLRESKDVPNRAAIEKAIREIDELLAKQDKAKNGPPKGIAQTPAVSGSAGGLAAPLVPAPPAGAAQTAVAESLIAPVPASAQSAPQAGGASAKIAVPPEAVVGTSVQHAGSRRTYAYITAGAAVAFIGGGVLFAARASKYEDELNARPHTQATIDDLSSTAKSSRTLSMVMFGAAAAAGIGAGLLYFLPSGNGVAVQGRF